MGTLYLVGTPIGNLEDISPRALRILSEVDFIAAEDTRVSLKLLNRFGIKKPMVSYYEHNQRERGGQILARILNGESCAIISDAGMPCISDPGEEMVALCAENAIPVIVIPGPNAAISALAISGLPTGRFAFEGFLSVKASSRRSHLETIRGETRTLVFYEAPHKLLATLTDLLDTLGDRRIALARELTKMHEEVLRTTLSQAVPYYTQNSPRGEFVIIVEGAKPEPVEQISLKIAVEMTRKLQAQGIPLSQAAKDVAAETGYKKGDLYKAALC